MYSMRIRSRIYILKSKCQPQIFGGTDRNDSLIAGLHLYQKSKWMKIETSDEFITPRRQSALAVVNDKEILLFGGVDKVNKGQL